MAVFKDEDEVYTYMAGIFRRGLEVEGLADKLAGSGVVLRVHYTDPDAVVTVDMPEKVVETGADSGVTPNVELFMSADTGNRFWLGKVNLTMAMALAMVMTKVMTNNNFDFVYLQHLYYNLTVVYFQLLLKSLKQHQDHVYLKVYTLVLVESFLIVLSMLQDIFSLLLFLLMFFVVCIVLLVLFYVCCFPCLVFFLF